MIEREGVDRIFKSIKGKRPDDGNGDDDAYNRGWNACLDALAQQPAADTLADTQRAIIEAAERRGYERAMSERPVTVDKAMTPCVGGMTLRDYFAAQELAKKHAVVPRGQTCKYALLAEHCYRMADAMLAARKKQGEQR